jgi:O-antigen/teichoic acid export membrane protein
MSFSAVIGSILAIPSRIITARFLGPSVFGVLAVINLIVRYCGYTHLGLLKCLPRNVPIAYGRGDDNEAILVKDTVFSGFFILSAIGVVVLWILFLCGITFRGALDFASLVLVSLIIAVGRIQAFLRADVKAEGSFPIIGRLDLIQRIASPLLALVGVIFFGLTGILVAMLLAEVIAVGYLFSALGNLRFRFRMNLSKTLDLLKTGFMIFMNSISEGLFMSVGLMIIAAMLTTKEVGLYSLALGITMAKKVPFASPLNMLVYRKMMVEAGRNSIEEPGHFRKYNEKLLALYLLFHGLVLGCMLLLYVLIINTVLANYEESLPLMLILYFGYLIYVSRFFLSIFLDATDQLHKKLVIILVGLGLNALLSYISIAKGYGITGVSAACSLSFVLNATIVILISFRQIYGNILHGIAVVLKVFLISGLLTGILTFFYSWDVFHYTQREKLYARLSWGTADLGVKGIVFSVLCVSVFLALFRDYHLFKEITAILSYMYHSIMKRLKIRQRSQCIAECGYSSGRGTPDRHRGT